MKHLQNPNKATTPSRGDVRGPRLAEQHLSPENTALSPLPTAVLNTELFENGGLVQIAFACQHTVGARGGAGDAPSPPRRLVPIG
jgi:hypothetical protein